MQQRQLGKTGETIAAIGLGCMGMVGWYGKRDDAEARATIERALDLGINHLDTAAVYQDGANERFVGECIRRRRNAVFLATKCGLSRTPGGTVGADNHPETIRSSCDESLLRLRVDHIDLFYLHRIDSRVPIAESMGAMGDLVNAGKIRHVGLSEASPDTLRRAHAVQPVAALQSELSPWTRTACRPSLEVCRELGIGFVAYSPLGRGFLTGAISSVADLPEGDTRHLFPRFQGENLASNLVVAERLQALARAAGCTPAQLSLAWVLAQWEGILPIPGTKKRRYLEDNAGAVDVQLSPRQLAAIEEAVPEQSVAGERYPDGMLGTLNV
ncbi:MAG: aldo/keto reductase [Gammaproteobacteria bacterium]